jgi:hypothetical protein
VDKGRKDYEEGRKQASNERTAIEERKKGSNRWMDRWREGRKEGRKGGGKEERNEDLFLLF